MSAVFVMIALFTGLGGTILGVMVSAYAIEAHKHGRMLLSTLLLVLNLTLLSLVLAISSGCLLLLMDIAQKLGMRI